MEKKVVLHTTRLTISPMSEQELADHRDRIRQSDPEMSAAYGEMLEGMQTHPAQALWYAAWKIALADGREIGDACFKGLPAHGRPEIGYGIDPAYWGQDYATEAVGALCRWAMEQNGVSGVEAETEPENLASQRVLEKNGFRPTGQMGEEGPRFIWEKPRNPMKNLILINGTMGAGKSTVCGELKHLLPRAVFLDGDWCWDMHPFVVTGETRALVLDNICTLLNRFLRCTAFENVIFCWVMHEQAIVDSILSQLEPEGVRVRRYTLVLSEQVLRERLGRDVARGIRSEDVIGRSVARLELYDRFDNPKIDVSGISAAEAAAWIAEDLFDKSITNA